MITCQKLEHRKKAKKMKEGSKNIRLDLEIHESEEENGLEIYSYCAE